jgi:hypothetical protein
MTLRSGIALAIERAVERRGCWVVETSRSSSRRAWVIAAVDGSLQLGVPREWEERRGLRKSQRFLGRDAMRSLGFEEAEHGWFKPIRAYPGVAREAAGILEGVFTEQFGASLDDDATVDEEYPGVVPGRPVPPPDAPHEEHIRASLALFDVDPEADVCIHAGLPSHLFLQLSLSQDGRVVVVVTPREEVRPEIPGFGPDDEIEWAVQAAFEIEEVPAVATGLLHERLSVDAADPLWVELGTALEL